MRHGRGGKKERLYPYRPICDWLLDLPPEMLVRIFMHCPRGDLVRISQCNKLCYNLVVNFLCQYFQINWWSITARHVIQPRLPNLRYAQCLVFQTSDNPFDEGPAWAEVDTNYAHVLRFCDKQKLKTLHLGKNKMTDAVFEWTLERFGGTLESLKLDKCSELTTKSLSTLGDLCCVQTLHISACGITDADVLSLTRLQCLHDLSIVLCPKITNKSLEYISGMFTLRRLHYAEYGILNPHGFECLAHLCDLEVLDIGGCLIGKDDFIRVMSNLKKLSVLNVGSIIINEEELTCISHLRALTRLGLSGCNIMDEELVCLHALKSLNTLDLSWHNDISDAGLVLISRMDSLHALSLKFCNKVTDDGIRLLEGLSQLRVLDISVCELLTDLCLVYIGTFPSIRVLYCTECAGITEVGEHRLRALRNEICFEDGDFELEDAVNLAAYK